MIEKTQEIYFYCYENVEFSDKFTNTLSETDSWVNDVLNTFSGIISAVLNISVIISMIATINLIFIIFGLSESLLFLHVIMLCLCGA